MAKSIYGKIEYLLKHNIIIQTVFRIVFSAGIRCLGLFIRIDPKMILFSGHGRKYTDSPKAIYEAIKNKPEFSDYKCVWVLEDTSMKDQLECKVVKEYSFKYFIAALKAKYWIACVGIEHGLRFKRKETVYLNTLHGIPIKLCGNAAPGRKDYDFSQIDFVCCSGEYDGEIFVRDYKVKPESLLRCGLPRNDALYRTTTEEINTIKQVLGIEECKKVILYVPTWRDKDSIDDDFSIAPPLDTDKLKSELGNQYTFLFRMHPFTIKMLGIDFDNTIRDVSNYPEINDLYKIADVLITDYSSAIFDYAITGKAAFCFAYDYEEYIASRGLYIDLKSEMPNGIFTDADKLISSIKNIDWKTQKDLIGCFKEKYSPYGGNAINRCINEVFSK